MTQAAGWASQTTTYGYGAFGQVVTATLPNGVTTSYGYDAAQRQTSIAHTYSSQTLATYTYTLDANGNRTRTVELVQGLTQGSSQSLPDFGSVRSGAVSTSGARTGISGLSGGAAHGWLARWPAATSALTTTIDYGYDNLARLTSAAYSDGTSFGYTYDGVGNRLTQTACLGSGCTPATTTYTYDNANRLATVNGATYTYDANGNLTADGARTYAYDAADRLISLTQSGNTSTYAYNGQGDRVSQTAAGVTTRYTLDLASLYTQVLADGSTSYLYGLGRIGEQQTGGWAYHLTDALGSVRQLTTSAGAVSLARRFDPYGAPLTMAGSGSSIYGFTGEQTDPSGHVFLRARYYVPGMGRFLTRDTWAGDFAQPLTLNRWAYVNGNPINMVDPSGHFAQAIALLGAWVLGLTVVDLLLIAGITILVIFLIAELTNPGCTGRIISDIGAKTADAVRQLPIPGIKPGRRVGVQVEPILPEPPPPPPGGPRMGPIQAALITALLMAPVLAPYAVAVGDSLRTSVDTETKQKSRKSVLIVGEYDDGDMAISFQYARNLAIGHPDWDIVGTSYSGTGNGQDEFFHQYNLTLIRNVNATQLDLGGYTGTRLWDAIIFNNPYTKRVRDYVGIAALIRGFRESASKIVAPGGEMQINVTQSLLQQSSGVRSALGYTGTVSGLKNMPRFIDSKYYASYQPRYSPRDEQGAVFLADAGPLISFSYRK